MSRRTTQANPITDPFEYLKIERNPNGTITRAGLYPNTTATPDPDHTTAVLSKDIPINHSINTWARIFLPKQVLDSTSTNKLPLIVYYHGGGFILLSAATNICHDFCVNIADELPAVIVSVEYRLAPEHRLPAAYDDAMEALHWIKATDEVWLTQYADYGNCYIMGTSAGGNIAYHAGLRAALEVDNLVPLKIRGLLLHHPFFGGVQRSESEMRLVSDPVLPPVVTDVLWDLSLPSGVDRDHEYCNPTVEGRSNLLDQIRLLGWRVLVSGCHGDPLIDRQMELAKVMKEKGVNVVGLFADGGYHGIDLLDQSKTKEFAVVLKTFILSSAPV